MQASFPTQPFKGEAMKQRDVTLKWDPLSFAGPWACFGTNISRRSKKLLTDMSAPVSSMQTVRAMRLDGLSRKYSSPSLDTASSLPKPHFLEAEHCCPTTLSLSERVIPLWAFLSCSVPEREKLTELFG